ncbi:MAG: hypothetical protein KME12_23625 [Trichocoleus desertorum ATA4-8-CV12]|jgi:hypothetical protein|nr:hypothetical protein [Trichocoleus desertorum ATA4-8-CV12]
MAERLTLLQLEERINKLQAEVQMLRAEQDWMKRVFQVYGINGPWVSPQQAADLSCISREGVMWHVRRAERFRELKRDCECKYGIHYRQIPKTKDDQPRINTAWQIHVIEFEKLLAVPQDNLKAG